MTFLKEKLFSPLGSLNVFHALNDGFGASMVLFLPFIAVSLHLNLTEVGALGTVIKSASIFLAIPAGYIALRIGGFHAILLAALIYACGFLGVGFSSNYILLLIMFLIGGLGYGTFHPIAFALIARWAPKERRGREMGNFTAMGDVGKIGISALLTIIIVAIGWRPTAFIYAGIAISIVSLYYLIFLRQRDSKTGGNEEKKISVGIWGVLRNRRFLLATITGFCDSFASSAVYLFLPFLLLSRAVTPAALGIFTSAFFIGNLAGKTVFGRISDKVPKIHLFVGAELSMAAIILLLANSHLIIIIFICAILLGIFTTGTVPIGQTMVLESVEHHGDFEKAFGVNELIGSTGSTLAPIFLGFLADRYGIVTAFDVMAIAAVIATIPAFGFHRTKNQIVAVS